MKLLALIILLASCRSPAQKAVGPRLGELADKVKLYQELGQAEKDADGWIMSGDCDGLLHNSLAYLGGLISYDVLAKAQQSPGKWTRTPKGDCLSSGRSKSSISRDQLLGLVAAAVNAKDLKTLKDLRQYAKDNNYIMGEHDGSVDGRWRVVMTPSFYSLIEKSINYLEGESSGAKLTYEVDFTDHLDAISFYIDTRVSGGATVGKLKNIIFLSESDPNNAFYLALRARYDPDIGGYQEAAVNVLLRDDLFPAKKLPSSEERCSGYLWMHGEKDGDWTPCQEQLKTHPGHDLLFAAHVIYLSTLEE